MEFSLRTTDVYPVFLAMTVVMLVLMMAIGLAADEYTWATSDWKGSQDNYFSYSTFIQLRLSPFHALIQNRRKTFCSPSSSSSFFPLSFPQFCF